MKTMKKLLICMALGSAIAACGTLPKDQAISTTFQLTNAGKSSIWMDSNVLPLTIILDGERYIPGASCACRDDCTPTEGVDVSRFELRPKEQWEMEWDGAVRGTGEECPDLRDAIGQQAQAEFCWYKNISGVGQFNTDVSTPECETVDFVIGQDNLIDVTPDTTVESTSETIPLVIENARDSSIFVQTSESCGSERYYQVTFGDEVVFPTSTCGTCNCADMPCATDCSLACEMNSVDELEPGSDRTVDMPLVFARRYDWENDRQCIQRQFVPVGPLTATLCYGPSAQDLDGDDAQVVDETCEQVEFSLEDDEVRLVVD